VEAAIIGVENKLADFKEYLPEPINEGVYWM
jgi:hypothetical protein